MKRFGLLVVSAILGSAITLGVFNLLQPEAKSLRIEHTATTPVVNAAYTVNNEGELVPLDFTEVAENVMPAVVHIKSIQEQASVKEYQPDNQNPYRDFFNDDFFRHFFGPPQGYDMPGPQNRNRGIGAGPRRPCAAADPTP